MSALTLMVCPHDAARGPQGWHRLAQYLTARLETRIHFEPSLDFADFRQGIAKADLVYANPSDGLALVDGQGFCPIARPAGTYDEALIVTGPEGPLPGVEAIHGAAVASVEQLLPTRLALKALGARGIVPGGLRHRDSWLSVVRSVWNGEARFGFLYRDAYDELSPQGRAMVRVLEATNQRTAFHMLTARPGIRHDLGGLTRLLSAMQAEPAGREVLAEMQLGGWCAVGADELAAMRAAHA